MASLAPDATYVAVLRRNYNALEAALAGADASVLVDAQAVYAKAMVFAAGNCFERRIGEILVAFASARSSGDPRIVTLVRRKAVDRQFHTLFDWTKGRVNSFLSLFGDQFKDECLAAIEAAEDLQTGAKDFMTLVAERNLLAHDRKIEAGPQFTTDEVYSKLVAGLRWANWLEEKLTAAPNAA